MRKLLFIFVGAALLFAGYMLFFGNPFSRDRFADYRIDKTYTVDFTFPDLAREEFGDREKADQAKDWLLYSVLSNSKLTSKEFAETTFDLAPVRYGFNNTLASFDYGDTRAKFIGDGEVVALIPVSDEKTKNDNIAHILDEIRKNQGEKPKKAYVFEYDLNTEGKFSRLTRRENIDAETFFTTKMGYFEMPIRNLKDLKVFMDKTEDITYAKQDGEGLVLGGRHLLSRTYGKATPEDVAAIWQSEKYIQENQAGRDLTISSFESQYKSSQDSVFNGYNELLKNLEFENGLPFTGLSIDEQNELIDYVGSGVSNNTDATDLDANTSQYKSDKSVIRLISNLKAALAFVDDEYQSKEKKLGENLKDIKVASASGFSLDPDVNFEKSIEFVKANRIWFEDALQPDFTVDQLLNQLREENGDLMNYAIQKVGMGWGAYFGLGEKAKETCTYQKARYDGKLQGTEVGMTLFYTDLLAKIWAGNRFNSKPIDFIAGFKDHEQSYMAHPKVFELESQSLSAVRLWFGPNKNGFQSSNGKTELTFARNATQIFALSNDPGSIEGISPDGTSKHLEKQASAQFDVALSWWNNHFEEVARFEQQYERLNEIMKWSTIISWLNVENRGSLLNFLDRYPVNDSLWFSDWARSNKDLKFKDWEKVSFFQRGYLGNSTEAIPILFSPNRLISGGVSLAEKSLIKEAPELLTAEKSLFRRGNIVEDIANGERAFITPKETNFAFVEVVEGKSFKIDFQAKEGFKLRNRFGEIENTKFQWNLSKEPGGNFTLRSKLGETSIGELHSATVGKNGFSIGFKSRAVDKGMAIGKQTSDVTGDIGAFLGKHPEVARHFRAESGEWCVQAKNAEEWMIMRIHPEDARGTVNLESGWQARTSGSQPNSKIIEMKWVNEAEVKQLANKATLPDLKVVDVLDESPQALTQRLIETNGEQAAKAELSNIRKKGIAEAEEFAAKGEFERAASQSEKVIRHFGETTELNAMRVRFELKAGLQAMENGNLNTASNFFNEALTTQPLKGKAGFFQEIKNQIDNAAIEPAMKSKVSEMLDFYYTDKQIITPGHWEGYKSLSKQVSINEAFSKKGAKIIYADNAAFSHIDPSEPFETVIGQIRQIPTVQVYDISAKAIGRNTRMYATVEPKLSALGRPIPQMRFRVSPGSALNNCKDLDDDGNCDNSYTVPGPAYYVTAPSLN